MLRRRLLDSLDFQLVIAAVSLAAIGILAIASATAHQAGKEDLWRSQLLWFGIVLVASVVVLSVDYHLWAEFSLVLHAGAMVLLVLVLLFGREVGGNQSWLVVGPIRFQPSELAKWTTCLVLATYLTERGRGGVGLRELAEMGALAGVPMMLIMLQPDLGTALTFVPIYSAAVVLGGVRWKIVVGAVLLGVLLIPVGWQQLKPYQKERVLATLDPDRDPAGVGYQARQSKIAIGSGGLTGKGLFQGTQSRLNFLPAQHTDFVLAVVAEDLGFAGAGAVLALFYYLLFRGIAAARSAQDRLGTYACLLIVAWLAGQLAINIGMVVGLLPTIGVPLPLVSYGGTALLAAMAGVALLLNVHARRFVN
jgi:rod shape determining protein RodA